MSGECESIYTYIYICIIYIPHTYTIYGILIAHPHLWTQNPIIFQSNHSRGEGRFEGSQENVEEIFMTLLVVQKSGDHQLR